MKGYKGMNMDMTCRGMQYKVGKSYHIDNPVLCERGFHFCKTLEETFQYYRCECSRFFEVEASGEIKYDNPDRKMVASDIKIVREIDKSIINRIAYSKLANGSGIGCGKSKDKYTLDPIGLFDPFYSIIIGGGFGDGNGYRCGNGWAYDYGDEFGNCYNTGDGIGYGHNNNYCNISSNSILEILNFK